MKNLFYFFLLSAITGCQKDEATTGSFTDSRDGHVYQWIQLGNQTWMAENLDFRTSDSSWHYNDDSATYHKYGRLYSWNCALTAAPPGWHIPSDDEWTELAAYLGGDSVAGGKMKEYGIAHWTNPNSGATNESSFTAFGGGYRDTVGAFGYIGYRAYWWSTTQYNATQAWCRNIYHKYAVLNRTSNNKISGYNVRCVKD